MLRVRISWRDHALTAAALAPARDALRGRLSPNQLRLLRSPRHARALERAVAGRNRRVRDRLIATLARRASRSRGAPVPLLRALTGAGARLVAVDALLGSLTAYVPSPLLGALSRRRDVLDVERAPLARERSLAAQTSWTGAQAWWASGHLGGTGAQDTSARVWIVADDIQEDHPVFAGIPFARPAGTSTAGVLHGTAVASAAVAAGADGCPTCTPADPQEKGVAPGPSEVLNGSARELSPCSIAEAAWAFGIAQSTIGPASCAGVNVPGASRPPNVASDSHGSQAQEDDSATSVADALASTWGLSLSYGTGNFICPPPGGATWTCTGSVPTNGTIDAPCIAYNVICVGGAGFVGDGSDHSADGIADFSGRGPSPAGRKKPDLVALAASGTTGTGTLTFARWDWATSGSLWLTDSGTSYAAPQAAGGAALLYGAGITDPLAIKAILIDSARPGRLTPASAMGTQTSWQPDWGWGELDLNAAMQQRTNFHTAALAPAQSPSAGVRFYAASTQAAGDRATLIWNRRQTSCLAAGCQPGSFALSNLDLYELDRSTGAIRSSSTSTIDNVEQLRSPSPATVIYKVKNASTAVHGRPDEPYALASTRALTPLAAPQPAADLAVSPDHLAPGDQATVTAALANTSPDLSAQDAQVTLQLPPGVELATGSPPATQQLGSLAARGSPGDRATASWTIRATATGAHDLAVSASTTRYGEVFGARAAAVLSAQPPAPQPPGTTPTPPGPSPKALVSIRLLIVRWSGRRLTVTGRLRPAAGGVVLATARCGRARATRHVRAIRGRFDIREWLLPVACARATRAWLHIAYAGDRTHRPRTLQRVLHRLPRPRAARP
jgi:hypothetical protein